VSPCPVPVSLRFPVNGCNPNVISVDVTAGKTSGKWQVAWVGFYSTDVCTPIEGYLRQSQFAMGGGLHSGIVSRLSVRAQRQTIALAANVLRTVRTD